MQVKHVKELYSFIGLGGTDPFWAALDDDTFVIFKTFNNLQGNKSLVNEYIGYRIAILFNMPIPYAGVALLDNNSIISDCIIEEFKYPKEKYFGLGFYSTKIEKGMQLTAASVLNKICNIDDIPRIIAFDILLGNYDRNPGNLLIEMKKNQKKMYIIDHSHLFHIGCIWDHIQLTRLANEPTNIEQLQEFDNYHYSMFAESYSYSRENFKKIAMEINYLLTDSIIRDIIESIPNIWSVSVEEKESLILFLRKRRDTLNESLIKFIEGGKENVS